MSDRRNDLLLLLSCVPALALLCALAADAPAETKVIRGTESPAADADAPVAAATTPAKPATKPATTKPAKPAPAARSTASAPAPKPASRASAGTKPFTLPSRRPIVLDALHVEGRTEAPRVLFVHAGPTIALEDAPAHPSYLRDDFTAALSSPVRVRVRAGVPARSTTAGGNR